MAEDDRLADISLPFRHSSSFQLSLSLIQAGFDIDSMIFSSSHFHCHFIIAFSSSSYFIYAANRFFDSHYAFRLLIFDIST